MPKMRIELLAHDRAEAQKTAHIYGSGGRHKPSDDAVLAEIERRGRTPAGLPEYVGVTNGHPIYLKFDIEVYPEV
jgi:hypothetical protein